MLNERLRKLRDEKRITQGQLAAAIGVEKSSISKYESLSNPIMPSMDVIFAIADYFRVSIDYLVGRSDEPMYVYSQGKEAILSTKKELPEQPSEEPTTRMDLDFSNDLPKDRKQLELFVQDLIRKSLEGHNKDQ